MTFVDASTRSASYRWGLSAAAVRLMLTLVLAIGPTPSTFSMNAGTPGPDVATAGVWIKEMKASPRGPFSRIRWFCKDGAVLAPAPHACRDRGGGAQHGEWNDRVKRLRTQGYYIANVYADLDADAFAARSDRRDLFSQMLVEEYLIRVDNGWVLRNARYYRGALQEEGERAGVRRLLHALLQNDDSLTRDFFLLRTGVEMLSHGFETGSIKEVRQRAAALAQRDAGFQPLRSKIHVKPGPGDAKLVRAYAAGITGAELRTGYHALADLIEAAQAPRPLVDELNRLSAALDGAPGLRALFSDAARDLADAASAEIRFELTADLLVALRRHITAPRPARLRLAMLSASVRAEAEHFAAAAEFRSGLASATRRQRLRWLAAGADAAYGAGLIGEREREAVRETFRVLRDDRVTLEQYKESLDYLALVPGWGDRAVRFQLGEAVRKLAAIEPLADTVTQDLLRGSPLFFYAVLLEDLARDANQMAGTEHLLFGEPLGTGLRGLNPGLARGTLRLAPQADGTGWRDDGIYLLPETVADLAPVAGILTAGEGNALSHVQLLARNLGIPNVVVDRALTGKLAPKAGRNVLLAVSPGGSVRLYEDDGQWDALFADQGREPGDALFRPDLRRLDLEETRFVRLSGLGAEDSGRIVGPKAARLAELRRHYPQAVADGVVIPFGVFRRLLDQPYPGSETSVFEWMVAQYRHLDAMPAGSPARQEATQRFRRALEHWIENADPGDEFRRELRDALHDTFGADGSYGVFVRSDTNVEDLAGFTGAGLNLTVPNVVGVDHIMAAILRVWASPFTARAFAWRQARMADPQHVYPAVLLQRSVPVAKSGVLVTRDIDTGAAGWLSVAVNEGVGGAVDGQAAESLRIAVDTGAVKLLARAAAPWQHRLSSSGGVERRRASGRDAVLDPAEIRALIELVRGLPERFPSLTDADGEPAAADVEFGFVDGELLLFQIRPLVESRSARRNAFLNSLDTGRERHGNITVDLEQVPPETPA